MKKYDNYESTQAFTGDFETIKLGGHICKILKVTVTPAPVGKQYDDLMTIEFDIAEGEQKGFYQRRFDEDNTRDSSKAKWKGKLYQTIKQADLRFFKGFLENIEMSNTGYKWDWDENKLVSKLFGGVFGEEEYKANDGTVKIATKCMKVTTVQKIKEGVPVPEVKRLAGYHEEKAAFNAMDNGEDDLPF